MAVSTQDAMTEVKLKGGDDSNTKNPEIGAGIVFPNSSIYTPQSAVEFGIKLEEASWKGSGALKALLPLEEILKIFQQASSLLKTEPTLVEVSFFRGRDLWNDVNFKAMQYSRLTDALALQQFCSVSNYRRCNGVKEPELICATGTISLVLCKARSHRDGC
jgi:hypothetical protein